MRSSVWLLLLMILPLAACGDEEAPSAQAARPNQSTPEATFEAFRQASVAGDWIAVYELHLPSERAKTEARWKTVRGDSSRQEILDRLAAKADVPAGELAALEWPAVFAKVRARELGQGGPELLDQVRHTQVLRLEPVQGEQGAVIVKFQFGEVEIGMPMKLEKARWWMHRSLEALLDG